MKRTIIGSLTAGALLFAAPSALATPFDDACPEGFLYWEVSTEPYQADNAVDEEGDDDGIVCARALGQGINRANGIPLDFQIYQFMDA